MSPGPVNNDRNNQTKTKCNKTKTSTKQATCVNIPLNEMDNNNIKKQSGSRYNNRQNNEFENNNNRYYDNNNDEEELRNDNVRRRVRTVSLAFQDLGRTRFYQQILVPAVEDSRFIQLLQYFDTLAKRGRKRIHGCFYSLGYRIQRYYWQILIISCALLGFPCIFGLKHLKVEVEIEKLWVASEGRLQEETKYTESMLGTRGFSENNMVTSEVLIQVVKDEDTNILTVKNLLYHFKMLQEIMTLTIQYENESWGFSDFCVKYGIPPLDLYPDEYEIVQKISPCKIMTPLDCFWEGAKIISPDQKSNKFSWQVHTPLSILYDYGLYQEVETLADYLRKIGATDGYLKKPCLNPLDVNCPIEFKNKNTSKLDIGAIMTGGCYGVARKYMHWLEGAIMSGVQKNSSGFIKSAKGLQTILYITNEDDFFERIPRRKLPIGFTKEKAKLAIKKWKRAITETITKKQRDMPDTDTVMMSYTTESFYNLVKSFSNVDIKNIGIGVSILVCQRPADYQRWSICYAFITFRRWTTSVFSYSCMGVLGPVGVCLSIACGIVISHTLGLHLSVLTTQVLPFVGLFIGLDNVFLLLRTYVYVCDTGLFTEKQILPITLAECGLSLTLTMFTNILVFLIISWVPIIALKEFCYQIAIVIFVTWYMLLFILIPLLSHDVRRQVANRTDCFHIKDDVEDEESYSYSLPHQQPINERNVENVLRSAFPSEGRSSSSPDHREHSKRHSQNRSSRQFNTTPREVEQSRQNRRENPNACSRGIKKCSLNYIIQKHMTDIMTVPSVKVIVLLLGCALFTTSCYGIKSVKQDLNLSEMLPNNASEKNFFEVRRKYFSYYDFMVITKEFDYANHQPMLYELYQRILKVGHVVQQETGESTSRFWLKNFSDWLKGYEKMYNDDLKAGRISSNCFPNCHNASEEARIVYRMFNTNPWDTKKTHVKRLVFKNGLINPNWFYLSLGFWYHREWYNAEKVEMKPVPIEPMFLPTETNFDGDSKIIPRFIPMAFNVNGLNTTEDYIKFIEDIRGICEEFKSRGLDCYPKGVPFTYWEQFVFLKSSLIKACATILGITWLLISFTIMSVKAATIVCLFMLISSLELYGLLGLLNVNLNAISAAILIMSTGIGLEYSLHNVLAFVNTKGDRNERMKAAIEITFASAIDGILTTVVMATLLSYSQYEFVNKYFFHLLFGLMCIIVVNGLFVLPVILSLFGPCCEVTNQAIAPTYPPAFVIKISPSPIIITPQPPPSRDLSTILEQTEPVSTPSQSHRSDVRASSAHSNRSDCSKISRPSTPATVYFEDGTSFEDLDACTETSFNTSSNSRSIQNFSSERYNNSSRNTRTSLDKNRSRQHTQNINDHNFDRHSVIDSRNIGYRQNNRPATGRRVLNKHNVKTKNSIHESKKRKKVDYFQNNDNNSSSTQSSSITTGQSSPYFIEVQSRDSSRDSNVSRTSVKATISIEVEQSHPFAPSEQHVDSR